MSSHIRAVQAKWGARRSGGTLALTAAEAPAVAVSLGGLADVEEDAPDLLVIGAAAAVEEHAAAPSARRARRQDGSQACGCGRPTAGGVTPSSSAARRKLRWRAAASKKRRQSRGGRGITNRDAGNRGVGGEINTYFVIAQIQLSQKTSRGSHAGAPFHPCGRASRGYFSGT